MISTNFERICFANEWPWPRICIVQIWWLILDASMPLNFPRTENFWFRVRIALNSRLLLLFVCSFRDSVHSVGGDDQRVLLWKLEESMAGITQPRSMKNQHYSNIFCLAFNNDCSKIFSGGNDEALIVHDTKTYVRSWGRWWEGEGDGMVEGGRERHWHWILFVFDLFFSGEPYGVFTHAKAVYGVSVDTTNDQIFTTACDDGQVLVFDLRIGTQVLVLAKSRASFHAVEFHPMDGNLAITGNERDGAALWDLREYTR